MGQIRKFLRLTAIEKALLIKATILLGSIRLGLWLRPIRLVRAVLMRAPGNPARAPEIRPARERIVWAVSTARRFVPRTTCLSQALATKVLLAQNGYPAEVRIGVEKTGQGELQAHAWVESGGEILVGQLAHLSRYAVLPSLPTTSIDS